MVKRGLGEVSGLYDPEKIKKDTVEGIRSLFKPDEDDGNLLGWRLLDNKFYHLKSMRLGPLVVTDDVSPNDMRCMKRGCEGKIEETYNGLVKCGLCEFVTRAYHFKFRDENARQRAIEKKVQILQVFRARVDERREMKGCHHRQEELDELDSNLEKLTEFCRNL